MVKPPPESRRIDISVVPYFESDDTTQQKFAELAHRNGGFGGGIPNSYRCTVCQFEMPLKDLRVGVGIHSGIPVCQSRGCAGHGWELIRPFPGE